jgi:beta-N-acetylhexosaminidase
VHGSAGSDVEELTRRCVLAGFVGPDGPDWLIDQLGRGLGGVVLFASNVAGPDELAELTARLHGAGSDVVIAMDEEGGEVTRLDAVTGSAVPGAAALGHLDDETVTTAVHATIGCRLAEMGINVDIAPVADVNANPRNPVIGVRSFGAEPGLVARHVAAAVRGVQSSGVAAATKHFPGHGDTETDSHREVAIVSHSRRTLEEVDLPPFRAAFDAGSRAIMTGHLLVPSLDQQNVATLSPAALTTLLRDEMGFTGAVITDALEMKAVSATVGMVAGAVQSLIAGADLLCVGAREYPGLIDDIVRAVAIAVDDGRLPLERLVEAAARARALAHPVPGEPVTPLTPAQVAAVAGRALNVAGRLPNLTKPQVLEFHPPNSMAAGPMPWSLATRIAQLRPEAELVSDPAQLDPSRNLVVVVRDAARHPRQHRMLRELEGHTGAIAVEVGWPDPTPPRLPTIQTFGTAPALLDAAAQLICGLGTLQ